MKRAIILTLGLFIMLQVKPQGKTDTMLFGDVKSASSKEHIPYASIIVKGTNMGTTADGTGHFKLAHLPIGTNIIVAQALGYKSQEKEVFMKEGEAVTLFFELEDDVFNLEQVVITGTKTEHYIKDVPVRTEVITARAIENKNARNLFQALEGIPGVRVEPQCQSCDFTMIRMHGLGAEHTEVLINGQPMYTALAGVFGLQQFSTINVDRIEIVKGAGSALYGSGAIAGTINILTKEPSFTPSTTVDVQVGSYKTKYDILSSTRNEKGNIGLNIFAQRYAGDAIDETGAGLTRDEVMNKDGVSDRVATNLTNAGFGLFIDNAFMKNDKLIIRGNSVFEKRKGGTMTDDYYKNPFTDGTEDITTNRHEASLNYNKKIRTNSELNFTLAYVTHNRSATNDTYLGDYMDVHNGRLPDLRNMRPYLANENLLSSTLSFNTTHKNHNLIIGLQGFYSKLKESGMYVVIDETSNFFGESYRSDANKQARKLGLFIQNEWAVSDKLSVVPGIRFDSHHSVEEYTADRQVFERNYFPEASFAETSISSRLAVKYKLSKKFTLRANAGTGFRPPYGFSEDLHLCSGSPRVWKSSDMDPETSISYNFSADYYGKNIRASANLFRTDLKNKIGFTDADADVAALGYDYQWRNIDDAFVHGVELSVLANLTKNFDLGVGFTYNQGEYKNVRKDWLGTQYEEKSKYISRFPATTANLKVEYSPKAWTFVLIGNYQGTMYIDYYNDDIDPLIGDQSKIKKTDPFMLFNARVSKKLNQFNLYAGVNNILNHVQDVRYLDDAAFVYAPMYGTMFYGGVSVTIKH